MPTDPSAPPWAPRPWQADQYRIRDANGRRIADAYVNGGSNEQDEQISALIVAAVNATPSAADVERVARAIYRKVHSETAYVGELESTLTACVDGDVDFLSLARAALAAMKGGV